MMHVIGAMAEFERELIKERVNAGIAAARKRGVRFGRPKTYVSPDKIQAMRDAGTPWRKIAKTLKVGTGDPGTCSSASGQLDNRQMETLEMEMKDKVPAINAMLANPPAEIGSLLQRSKKLSGGENLREHFKCHQRRILFGQVVSSAWLVVRPGIYFDVYSAHHIRMRSRSQWQRGSLRRMGYRIKAERNHAPI